jgi:phage terminase large subunit
MSPAAREITAEFPEKLQFLFEPCRYKVAYGGRDGVKSWSFARALLLIGAQRPIRVLCARETQQSIRESVHQLLSEQVKRLGLEEFYRILEYTIKAPNGTEFIFAGLRNLTVEQIKSFESIDIVWVEEAQGVLRRSWQVLIPTIRKPGSEIWVSFNPELATDDTYLRWVISPPPQAKVVMTSYHDNAWLSKESADEIEYLRRVDPDTFQHVYEGATRSTVENAIYKAEIQRAELEGRITRVPYEPSKPVDTYWDLGYADMVSIWFAQAVGFEYRIIDYEEDTHKALDHYVSILQGKGYTLGTFVLPWDGGVANLGTGRSIRELLAQKGFKVRVLPQMRVADGINAVRTIFHQCWFDGERCADGLSGLRRYQWGEVPPNGVAHREPLHDAASHPADALRALAMHIRTPEMARKPVGPAYVEPPRLPGQYAPFG